MPAPDELLALVDRFRDFHGVYTADDYKEAELRGEFLDPFFACLGWDIYNKEGRSPATKDVVREYTVEDAELERRMPDYSFRIGGETKFFVEAKKPSRNLRDGVAAAFQVRTYGWSAGVAICVLSDFEELAVYECHDEPSPWDPPATGRRKYSTWTEYADRWEEISDLFSRDAVLSGALDEYAAEEKHDAVSVDEAFLGEIDGWRRELAHDIAANNPALSQRDLNYAVQQTIDRIVFLRISEDRGIERFGQLKAVAQLDEKITTSVGIYDRLKTLFRQADDRYNSGLFHFKDEHDRAEGPDRLTLGLTISDSVLRDIVRRLYFPHSAYRFAVFPASILGQVYEQFLGKVIRLDMQEGALVEEKPEVRKAGGVYYTPTYIVRYIVESSLGRLLATKNLEQLARGTGKDHALRVLDPACGSGSFLIEAYQYLLDWYLEAYVAEDPNKWARTRPPRIHRGPQDEWFLTGSERRRILLSHIYGVDIDPQAVEVTKLSLLLKVLESESTETIMQTYRLFHERALPDLGNNIKRGNSLIGSDFYERQTLSMLDEIEQFRVSAFDWEDAFPKVFDDGGFDAVIGNPPYLSIDDVWGKKDLRQRYLKDAYPAVYRDKTDILFYFIARALQVGKSEISFIVSRAFLEAFKADRLRDTIATHADVREIVDFRNFQVFPKVGITTAIISLTLDESLPRADFYQLVDTRFDPPLRETKSDPEKFLHIDIEQSRLGSGSWSVAESQVEELLTQIDSRGEPIGAVLHIGKGMETGRNNVFGVTLESVKRWGLAKDLYYVRARNSDIQRWVIRDSGAAIIYPENSDRLGQLPSVVQEHLKAHESELKERAAFKRGDCEWWKFTWPLHKDFYDRPRLLCPYLASTNRFALDPRRHFLGLTDTTVLFDNGQPEDLRYIMALLNSRLLEFRFRFIGKLKAGGVFEYFWNSVSKLPIRRIDFESPSDARLHGKVVNLADKAILLADQIKAAATEQDREVFSRHLLAVERDIDDIVYQLYDIDPNLRRPMEEALQRSQRKTEPVPRPARKRATRREAVADHAPLPYPE